MFSHPIIWTMRALWIALPFVLTPPAGDALDGAAPAVTNTLVVMAWLLWAAVLVASLVPSPVSLTIVRTVTPVSVIASAAVAIRGDLSLLGVLGVVVACTVTALALNASVGDYHVDGASYGDEQRFLLRVPAAFLVGPIPVMWALTATGLLLGPPMIAGGWYAAGLAALLIGCGLGWVSGKSFHALSKRWLVLVPAGLTIVDHIALTDPVLFQRSSILRFGRAEVGTDAVDLSGKALGPALEIRIKRPIEMGITTDDGDAEMQRHAAVVLSVGRPGAVLAAAATSGVAIE